MAKIVTPEIAAASGMTYEKLQEEAMELLVHAGMLTMIEQSQHGMRHPALSANECLGMAVRVIAEQALQIQAIADEAERDGV